MSPPVSVARLRNKVYEQEELLMDLLDLLVVCP